MKKFLYLCLAASVFALGTPTDASGIMNPKQFRGVVRQAYSAASTHQAIASRVFCYCGCDKHAGHRSLHDCFSSDHGTYCATCRAEMLKSAQLADAGVPVPQIKQSIHRQFSGNYPFAQKSPIYQAYEASLGIPIASSKRHRRMM